MLTEQEQMAMKIIRDDQIGMRAELKRLQAELAKTIEKTNKQILAAEVIAFFFGHDDTKREMLARYMSEFASDEDELWEYDEEAYECHFPENEET
jgi:hypothetical protein